MGDRCSACYRSCFVDGNALCLCLSLCCLYAEGAPLHLLADSTIAQSPSAAVITARKTPPSAVLATLTSTGQSIIVDLSGRSSGTLPGAVPEPTSGSCGAVLENENLGANAVCTWLTESQLRVSFGVATGSTPLLVPIAPRLDEGACLRVGGRMCLGARFCLSYHSAAPRLCCLCAGGSRLTTSVSACAESSSPASTLVFRRTAIRAVQQGVLSAPRHCVDVFAPVNPTPPFVTVIAPAVIGPCDRVSVDGSKSIDTSGRAPTVTWTVTSLGPSGDAAGVVTSTESYIVGRTLQVPSTALQPPGSSYRFTLTMTSFLLVSSSASVVVTVSDLARPVVVVSGESRVLSTAAAALLSTARYTVCSGDVDGSSALTYSWVLQSVTRDESRTESTFVVPPLTSTVPGSLSAFVGRDARIVTLRRLTAGAVYTVVNTVALKDRPTVTGAASFTFAVDSAGVSAFIVGGNRQLGALQDVELDATSSTDLDGFTAVPFAYAWSCVRVVDRNTDAPCTTSTGGALTLGDYAVAGSSSGRLRIPATTLPLGTYRFTVTASKVSKWVLRTCAARVSQSSLCSFPSPSDSCGRFCSWCLSGH